MSIRSIKMRLLEPQNDNKEAKKLRSEQLSESWDDIKQILHFKGLPYITKFICSELISRHHINFFTDHFGIEKTLDLIARKYY